MAFYDFILSRGTDIVQNNLAFMRLQLNTETTQEEFLLLKNCISNFLQNTEETLEDQVRIILSKLINQNIPLDNETSYRFINEYFASLRIFEYDMYLIKRVDLIEDVPLDDGIALAYLLDTKNSPISNICEGRARDYEDYENPANSTDAIMTWLAGGEVTLTSDLQSICFLDNLIQDYLNMRKRKSSIYFNSDKILDMLNILGQKPILITNILPNEYDRFLENELNNVN